jgi:hypothetical protein
LIRLIIANPASIFCLNSAAIRKKIELSYQKLASLKLVTLFHTHSLFDLQKCDFYLFTAISQKFGSNALLQFFRLLFLLRHQGGQYKFLL